MPHEALQDPSLASSYKIAQDIAYQLKLPKSKKALIKIRFSNPVWENAGSVFDLTTNALVAHDNNQHPQRQQDGIGPFESDHDLLIVGSHKDGDYRNDLPWHQSWLRVFSETASKIEVGFSDSSIPRGNFNEAHVQITVDLI